MSSVATIFRANLESHGLWEAMRELNATVPYRYTAIFAFDGDMLHNVCLIDKTDQNITKCSDQPITESYCMYIHQSHERFSVEEAPMDQRVAVHPKRHKFQSYYGIPLFGSKGKMLGTVCHFDTMPVRVTDEVATALDDVGPLIAEAAFKEI